MKLIGSGLKGSVFAHGDKAKKTFNDSIYYLEQKKIWQELQVLKQESPIVKKYLPKLYQLYNDKNCIDMEYLSEKDGWVPLNTIISNNPHPNYKNILIQILEFERELVKYGKLYSDLHAGNIMYNVRTGNIKFIDLGSISDFEKRWESWVLIIIWELFEGLIGWTISDKIQPFLDTPDNNRPKIFKCLIGTNLSISK